MRRVSFLTVFGREPSKTNNSEIIVTPATNSDQSYSDQTLSVTSTTTDLAQVRTNLDLAIVELEKKMRRPEWSVKNLGTVVVNGAAVADELAAAIMNPDVVEQSAANPMNIVKSIGVGFGLIFSGANQFNKYWQRQQKAAEMTELLIRGIDPRIVEECFYEYEDKASKQKIKANLSGEYDPEQVIKAMSEHCTVSILLKDGKTVITLKNITMLNRKTAIALLSTLIGPAVYTGSQVVDYLQPEQTRETSTFSHAAVILATGTPFTDVWNTIEAICYGQEKNILEAIRLIIVNCYKDNIYMVPEKLLRVLENFVKPEIVSQIREAKDEVLADSEAQHTSHKNKLRG